MNCFSIRNVKVPSKITCTPNIGPRHTLQSRFPRWVHSRFTAARRAPAAQWPALLELAEAGVEAAQSSAASALGSRGSKSCLLGAGG